VNNRLTAQTINHLKITQPSMEIKMLHATSIIKGLILSSTLLFTSMANAGEFDNHCTNGLSKHALVKTSCKVNEIYKGKTYCFSSEGARDSFLFDEDGMIAEANKFYASNKQAKEFDVDNREKISQVEATGQVNSKDCNLSNKYVGYLNFDELDLRHCNLENTSFFGAYLRGANLSGANMKGSYLNLARLENADLSGADLTNATIFQAIFDKTNFKGANLTNARVIGTLGNVDMSNATINNGRYGLDIGNQPMGQMRFDAVGANLENSVFEGADINRANLRFANLRNANLRNVDLFRADLSQADLTGADITGANLKEAILDAAIMKDVKGLSAIAGYDVAEGKCRDCSTKH
jgi:uncharacterized protein YjbI with pentapeptide repeats